MEETLFQKGFFQNQCPDAELNDIAPEGGEGGVRGELVAYLPRCVLRDLPKGYYSGRHRGTKGQEGKGTKAQRKTKRSCQRTGTKDDENRGKGIKK